MCFYKQERERDATKKTKKSVTWREEEKTKPRAPVSKPQRTCAASLRPWPAVEGSCALARRAAEECVARELRWASHLSLSAVMLPALPSRPVNTARVLNQALQASTTWQVWITCPLVSRREALGRAERRERGEPEGTGDVDDAWANWDCLRRLCNHSAALLVALELTHDLPSLDAARRWRGSLSHHTESGQLRSFVRAGSAETTIEREKNSEDILSCVARRRAAQGGADPVLALHPKRGRVSRPRGAKFRRAFDARTLERKTVREERENSRVPGRVSPPQNPTCVGNSQTPPLEQNTSSRAKKEVFKNGGEKNIL